MLVKFIIGLLLISAIYSQEQLYCEDKYLVEEKDGKFLLNKDAKDNMFSTWKDMAKHGKDSCRTLPSELGSSTKSCCYLQLKLKVNGHDSKLAGCYLVNKTSLYTDNDDISDLVRSFESMEFDSSYRDIGVREFKVKKAWIECASSSYLKIAGLLLFAFLF